MKLTIKQGHQILENEEGIVKDIQVFPEHHYTKPQQIIDELEGCKK